MGTRLWLVVADPAGVASPEGMVAERSGMVAGPSAGLDHDILVEGAGCSDPCSGWPKAIILLSLKVVKVLYLIYHWRRNLISAD